MSKLEDLYRFCEDNPEAIYALQLLASAAVKTVAGTLLANSIRSALPQLAIAERATNTNIIDNIADTIVSTAFSVLIRSDHTLPNASEVIGDFIIEALTERVAAYLIEKANEWLPENIQISDDSQKTLAKLTANIVVSACHDAFKTEGKSADKEKNAASVSAATLGAIQAPHIAKKSALSVAKQLSGASL